MIDRDPSIRRTVARAVVPLLSLSLLVNGAESTALVGDENIVVQLQPTRDALINLCADDAPDLGPVEDASDFIRDSKQKLRYDSDSKQFVTPPEALELIDGINKTYGVPIHFPSKSVETEGYVMTSIDENPDYKYEAVRRDLTAVLDVFKHFTPNTLRALDLNGLDFMGNISPKTNSEDDGSYTFVVGRYGATDNMINAANTTMKSRASQDSMESIVEHELGHAIDQDLLCGPGDIEVDDAFTARNTMGYIPESDRRSFIEDKYLVPSTTREFANDYAAKSVLEDRASTLAWTLDERGLILEGDPDWGSPLQYKQKEIVRRMEDLMPGFTTQLALLTRSLRYYGNHELANNLQNEHFPGEFLTGQEVISRMIRKKIPVEVFHGVVQRKVVGGYGAEAEYFNDPIILRDAGGKVNAIVWQGDDARVRATYFDSQSMTFYGEDQMPVLYKGQAGATLDLWGHVPTNMTVDGQPVPIEHGAPSLIQRMREQYPFGIDASKL